MTIDPTRPAASAAQVPAEQGPFEQGPVEAATVQLAMVDGETLRLPAHRPGTATEGSGDKGLHDGIALSLSSVIGSMAGLLSWVIATRLVSPEDVGKASQVVSAFILVAGAAQLNLGVGILRWLPAAGKRTGWLVWSSMLLIMPLAGALGLVYVLLLPDLARTAAGTGPWAWGLLVIVLATAGWGVFVVHDFTLVAIGKPWWAVWRNALFAVVRIGLLVALGALGLGAEGIVLSWAVPIVIWIVVGLVVLAVLTRNVSRRATGGVLPSRAEAIRFLGPTSLGHIGNTLLFNQVTVLVTERFGDATGAKFFLVWQAVTVVDITAIFFMNSLAVGMAREPERATELIAAARRRLLTFFLPLLAVGALVAEPALFIVFGPQYAEAADVLRILLLGLAFRLVVVHELGALQAEGRSWSYARLQLFSSLLVMVVVIVVPVASGSVQALIPVAIGYVAVQMACAATVLFSPARRRAEAKVPSS